MGVYFQPVTMVLYRGNPTVMKSVVRWIMVIVSGRYMLRLTLSVLLLSMALVFKVLHFTLPAGIVGVVLVVFFLLWQLESSVY